MSTKAKALTGNQGQAVAQEPVVEAPKVELRFVDYRKCNDIEFTGTFRIALIKTKTGKRYTRVINAKGEVILLVGARKDGTGTWNRTQLDVIASAGKEEKTVTTVKL